MWFSRITIRVKIDLFSRKRVLFYPIRGRLGVIFTQLHSAQHVPHKSCLGGKIGCKKKGKIIQNSCLGVFFLKEGKSWLKNLLKTSGDACMQYQIWASGAKNYHIFWKCLILEAKCFIFSFKWGSWEWTCASTDRFVNGKRGMHMKSGILRATNPPYPFSSKCPLQDTPCLFPDEAGQR